MGFTSTLLGKRFALRADIWFENRAVKDYGEFLRKVDFDDQSRASIQKNIEDERLHIKRWQESIEILKGPG